jgi:hypothetical protein
MPGMSTTLLEAIAEAFTWMESRNLRVGRIWLNPVEINTLYRCEELDKISSARVVELLRKEVGAKIVGLLWNVQVFESDIVPVEHIAMTPEGFLGSLLDPIACMPLLFGKRQSE